MQETQEMQFWSQGQADPLEEEIETYSSILAWKILCGQRSPATVQGVKKS